VPGKQATQPRITPASHDNQRAQPPIWR